jgi:hypothetical protein
MTGKELEVKLVNLQGQLQHAVQDLLQANVRKTKLEGAIELLEILIIESVQETEPRRSGKKKK